MADAAVTSAIEVGLETVVSLAADRVNLVLGFPKELERLRKSARLIRCFLVDAEKKMHLSSVQDWLQQLEEEVFKAGNLLDELNYENLRLEVKYRNQLKKKVCFFFSFVSTIGFRSRLASSVREINTNLERIYRDAEGLGLAAMSQIETANPAAAGASGGTTSRQTDSVALPNAVGRAEDESRIVSRLLSPSEKVISVIPITGMGGLGKTTLAKSVFNNPPIDGHFGKKIWACVAKKIEILELFKLILLQLTQEEVRINDRNVIVEKIGEKLKGERYFLVLDDVWNHEQALWNDFFTTFEGLNATKGSWCLLTTRLKEVANAVSQHLKMNEAPYSLGKLSDYDCWSILEKKVVGEEAIPKELEAIKYHILKRCDGLPLAARLIGGLLSNNRKEKWASIMEESLMNRDQDEIEQILKVSFDHLSPAPVKKCFAYCSIFPQDTKLKEDALIELWMAEGFVQPDHRNKKQMEEIGYDYLRILLQSSLVEEEEGYRITYYKMHDLVHDFARSVLNPKTSNQDRYLAVNSSEGTEEHNITKAPTLIHSLFLEGSISDDMLSKLENLHVLRLFGADVKVLPTSIGKLIHLHLLDISGSEITTLPKSLCKLYNLQTLRIDDDKLEKGLPKKMSNLIRLRHLHYYCSAGSQSQTPSRIGRLTCLQTLKFFDVGQQGKGHGIEELGTLRDLKGSLEIRNLEFVKGKEGAKLAKLSEKPNLSRVAFEWSNGDRESDKCDDDGVLEGLQPYPNLKKLKIRNFRGDQFPQWLVKSSTLVKLKLMSCRNLPTLGQISSLQDLYLSGLENTTCIGLSFYGVSDEADCRSGGSESISRQKFFPALQSLILENMGNLIEWKDPHDGSSTAGEVHEEDVFPLLERLDITNCPQLTTIPTPSRFPSLKELTIREDCHVSLAEKVLSNITILSSLDLRSGRWYGRPTGYSLYYLEKGPECSLRINGCGSLSTNMLEWLCLFPSLKCVEVEGLPNITTLRAMSCATCLETLHLSDCENLQELPEELYKFQALRGLKISNCPKINLLGLNPDKGQESLLKSLEKFVIITSCHELTRLPMEMLESCTSLRVLWVHNCPNLVSFPLDLRRTPSLQDFSLYDCLKLFTEMPKGFGFLTNLRKVRIGPYSDYSVIEFDWSGLASSSTLRELSLYGNPDTESLPHQLQYLTTITSLWLLYFGAIEVLPDWLGNLASLEKLRLWNCQKLQYLPSMAAIRQLTKLRDLQISYCPLLSQRCTSQGATNSEWPKISHISELNID